MKKQDHTFQVVFTPEPEGGYSVTVPSIPECITCGDTFEEAVANAREALLLCLEYRIDNNEDIPNIPDHNAVISSISVSAEELHA